MYLSRFRATNVKGEGHAGRRYESITSQKRNRYAWRSLDAPNQVAGVSLSLRAHTPVENLLYWQTFLMFSTRNIASVVAKPPECFCKCFFRQGVRMFTNHVGRNRAAVSFRNRNSCLRGNKSHCYQGQPECYFKNARVRSCSVRQCGHGVAPLMHVAQPLPGHQPTS